MCRVVHCQKENYDVYIGRGDDPQAGEPSKWGNPYTHNNNSKYAKYVVDSRDEAIDNFEQYLLNNKELMDSLHELKGKTLGCWCKPKRCHGDIIKKYVDRLEKLDHLYKTIG